MRYKSIFRILVLIIVGLVISKLIYAATYNRLGTDGLLSVTYQTGTKKWTAPASANKLKNPLAVKLQAAKDGKKIYDDNCAVCHGDKGKGDGPAGVELDPKPKDLASPQVQKQTDGAIFWKITTGNPPMDSWKSTLSDKQRWELVNFIRQLNKK